MKQQNLENRTYPPPFPLPCATFPLAPSALGFFRLSVEARWFFSFSARSMYSPVFPRIISLDRGFFSHFRASMNSSSAE
jgi:hypothetical protein